MNFNSLEYLCFLPIVCLVHWLLPQEKRWLWLLAGSWLFYLWWEPMAGLLLVGMTLVTWLCAGAMERRKTRRGLWLAIALLVTLGTLGVFKYAGFFASMLRRELPVRILLPVGISFYTFQTLSYVLDVYQGRIKPEPHFGYYALFVAFFPQLVAGPIERPEHLLPQLQRVRIWNPALLGQGGWLLLSGFFKKLILADGIAPLVDRVYGDPAGASGPAVVLATALFGIQIYCDFSGYTDIARGSARLLGIELMENFHRPYCAGTIRDFWRRWHISLTGWFTDYVYIPLGGSRRGLPRQLLSILIVFLLSGLWHGAGWTFVVWGGIHGLYQIGGVLWRRLRPEGHRKTPRLPGQCRTFLLVTFAWLFFRAESLGDAAILLSRLGDAWNVWPLTLQETLRTGMGLLCLWGLEGMPERMNRLNQTQRALTAFFLILAIAAGWLSLLSTGGQNAFIYFQF